MYEIIILATIIMESNILIHKKSTLKCLLLPLLPPKQIIQPWISPKFQNHVINGL